MKKVNRLPRLSSLLLAFATVLLCFALMPTKAEAVANGTCGDNVTWTLDEAGCLTIIGSGAMTDYNYQTKAPWYTYRSSVIYVKIDDGITHIGVWAFQGFDNLVCVSIPSSVTTIGASAFGGCTKMESIQIPSTVTSIGSSAFAGCSALTALTIPKKITAIQSMTFSQCSSLKTITVPAGVTSVGSAAFDQCYDLTRVNFAGSLYEWIRISVGSYNSYFTNATRSNGYSHTHSFTGTSSTVEATCESIGFKTMLCSCGESSIDAILPLGHDEVIDAAVAATCVSTGLTQGKHCGRCEEVLVEQSVTSKMAHKYSNGVCSYCGLVQILGSGTWGDNVSWSLNGFGALTISGTGAIDYAYSGTEYPWGSYSEKIRTIIVESGITDIPKYTFEYCELATTISLPETLNSIALNAFNDCGSLNNLLLPSSLTAVSGSSNTGYPAFIRCESLTDVYYLGTEEQWNTLVEGMPITSHNSEMTLHFLKLHEASTASCTTPGIDAHYQFDITSVYGSVYNLNKEPISDDEIIPALGHRVVKDSLDPLVILNTDTIPFQLIDGTYYSNNHTDNSSSEIKITAKYACTLTLQYGVSCEKKWDEFFIFHNDEQIINISGEVSNQELTLALDIGDVVTVRYIKDLVTSSGLDQGWVMLDYEYVSGDVPAENFEPTCTNAVICDYCDAIVKVALGHDFISHEGLEPDCVNGGWAAYQTCSRCDYSSYEVLPAQGHSGDTWFDIVTPTCTESGINARICSVCNETETVTVEPLGHSYDSVVTAPTCTEQGYTTNTCSACGDVTVTDYVDAKGHSFGDWMEILAPGCTAEGMNARMCACGETETQPVAALGHTYDSVVTEPNCTEQGYTTNTCTVCGDVTVTDYVDAKGHSFGDWVQTSAPGCDQNGEEERTCACGETETQSVAALGHSYDSVVTAPTCTEQGYTTNTCSVCGDVSVTDYVDAKGHSWSAWIQTVAPTCTVEGSQVRFCNCGVRETGTVAKSAHTCENGICTVCGQLESYYWVLSADAKVDLILAQDLYVDLNGFNLSGTITTNGCQIYGMDSTTNTYSAENMGYFTCIDENGAAIVPVRQFKTDGDMTGEIRRYMAIETESGFTFHRFYLGITSTSLNTATTGVGYKAVFYGDDMVKAQLDSFGYTMQLDGFNAITRYKSAESFVSGKTVTLRINNYDAANFGETALYASVCMQLSDGTLIQSAEHTVTMRGLIESVNAHYSDYDADQLAAVKTLIANNPVMQAWDVGNIYKEENV